MSAKKKKFQSAKSAKSFKITKWPKSANLLLKTPKSAESLSITVLVQHGRQETRDRRQMT